jgi:predicted transcriptional regulator
MISPTKHLLSVKLQGSKESRRKNARKNEYKTQVDWRRRYVFELSSKGHNQVEIAKTLQISESIISRDLAKECYSMKLDLLTNATVVDDAIRFVSESGKSKDKDREQVKSSSSSF